MAHDFTMPAEYVRRTVARDGRPHSVEHLDGPHTALLVVDMQRYFMEPPFLGACPEAQAIVPNVNRLAAELRVRGGLVVWLQNAAPEQSEMSWSALRERYSDAAAKARWDSLREGAAGFELWPDLDVQAGDGRVVKSRYSAFIDGSSNLASLLDEREIDSLLIAGVATNACCESTARDAMMLNYRVVMVSDACAAASDREHEAALGNFYLFFGDVQTTSEAITRFS
jgi:ureidoacrylate peracid hydrolase